MTASEVPGTLPEEDPQTPLVTHFLPSSFSRRSFLGRLLPALGALLGLGLLARSPRLFAAPARNEHSRRPGRSDDDEPSEAVKQVLRDLFGDRPIRTGHVQLDMPENPPDGRLVPVFIESDLPMAPGDHVKAIHLLVDKNPDIHVAAFEITPALGLASIDTRIKMRATSHVRALVETSGGKVWAATRKVFPGTNGCG